MRIYKPLSLFCLLFLASCHSVFESSSLQEKLVQNQVVKVFAILPLTGRFAEPGNQIKNAIELAYVESGNKLYSIHFLDNKGDNDLTKELTKEAIDDGARAIIGPLRSSSTEEVLKIANKKNVPVFSFSNNMLLLNDYEDLYLSSRLVASDMERLISYSIENRSSKSFAVAAPENQYGELTVSVVKQILKARNLPEPIIVRYPADTVYISGFISKLVPDEERKKFNAMNRRIANGEEILDKDGNILKYAELPELEFDTLIIGDYGERALIVGANLPQVDIDYRNITILGNSYWDRRIGRETALRGAYFTQYPIIEETQFNSDYSNYYSESASFLSAMAYNVVNVMSSLVYKEGETVIINFTSDNVANYINQKGSFSNITARKDGIIHGELAVYRAYSSRAIRVDDVSGLDYFAVKNYFDGFEEDEEVEYEEEVEEMEEGTN